MAEGTSSVSSTGIGYDLEAFERAIKTIKSNIGYIQMSQRVVDTGKDALRELWITSGSPAVFLLVIASQTHRSGYENPLTIF